MKINGSFVLREVAGEWLAIPVGESALQFGGMIVLNAVSHVIWDCLQEQTDLDRIVNAITDRFDISCEEARIDVLEFINKMREEKLIMD